MTLCSLCVLFVSAQTNPFIARVHEFVPAPGQFVNSIPMYEEDDMYKDMLLKVEDELVGRKDGMISLGAWGGYVTFSFDHPLVNVPDAYDLKVYGNAFINNMQLSRDTVLGSSEPGVVYVSRDENGNGLPDDTWYEIAGSEMDQAIRSYEVTYMNNGKSHITWTDNQGGKGAVLRNKYHTQDSYFPLWRADEKTAVYRGTLLPSNVYTDNNAYIFPWGYVDNWPNDDERAKINLDWAVDEEGEAVKLTSVDFVRVMTGVMVMGSLIGEASTEVCGAEDLHPEAVVLEPEAVISQQDNTQNMPTKRLCNGVLVIMLNGKKYSLLGTYNY